MSATDNPLKILITNTREAFASWLLGRPVETVRPLNVEFPARGIRSDLLFMVEDPPRTLLHLELQGVSSHRPMCLRELEYLSRTTEREIGIPSADSPRLHSVVLYVGKGAGANDTGQYTVRGIDDTITLRWQYTVIHLWRKTPQWLQQLGNPALLALAGQTKLTKPESELPKTLEQINEIKNDTLRIEVAGAFMSLLPSKEIVKMMKTYLESDEPWVRELPYLQMLRERAIESGLEEGLAKGHKQGLAIGLEQGLAKGLEQGLEQGLERGLAAGIERGLEKGLEKGRSSALRSAILSGVSKRFDPKMSQYETLKLALDTLPNSEILQAILIQLFTIESMEKLMNEVNQHVAEESAE